jgi:hypothetical protein
MFFMPFDRPHQSACASRFTPVADATGTPFTHRHNTDRPRTTAEQRDFREQADGAP